MGIPNTLNLKEWKTALPTQSCGHNALDFD